MAMKKELLKLFIPHFIEMAHKSNHFNATRQAKFYLRHAERLQTLLRECDYGRPEEDYYSAEFETLYQEMDTESAQRVFATTKLRQPAPTVPPTKLKQPVPTVPPTKLKQPAPTVPPTKLKQPTLTALTNETQPALTVTPKKPEKSVQFTQSVLSKDDLNKKVEALRNEKARYRKNTHSNSSSTETYELSQPNTFVVTNAQVHNPNTNPNTNSPESRTNVPDD
jgi:hypothetical protein